MKDLQGRVAVITGAASGIGLALAQACAQAGMRLVLADIEPGALERARVQFEQQGTPVLARRTDVCSAEQVQALADAAFERFGAVHLLCNNAGVASPAHQLAAWEVPLSDWHWILDVNLLGVVHGLRAFVPRMLAQGEEGHVVNTASIAGLVPGSGPYHASKHGVVCLSEGLFHDLRRRNARLSASVLCPGHIRTAIVDAERNRPDVPDDWSPQVRQQGLAQAEAFRKLLEQGYPPEQVAQAVLEAVRADRFYIVPAQEAQLQRVRERMQQILELRNPAH
jgi:NAD(P)-dependent dehydrogenase (short-subunit alcohol dehydrogenase family)